MRIKMITHNTLQTILDTINNYKNKYPNTKLYRKLSTAEGIYKQMHTQIGNPFISIDYLSEFSSDDGIFWEVITVTN